MRIKSTDIWGSGKPSPKSQIVASLVKLVAPTKDPPKNVST